MKLFFFDYDGTLYRPRSSGITPRVQDALHALQKAGHKIILCTGRCYGNLPQETVDLCFDGYATACGAATILDGKMAWDRRMDHALLLEILRLCERLELDGAAEGEKRVLFYRRPTHDPTVPEIHSYREYLDQFGDMPVNKLTLFRVPMPEELAHFFLDHNLSIINNGDVYYEIIQKGLHKGRAIQDVADYFGIPVSDTYCFGDSMNDADMLRAAGHSLVVANAPADIQAFGSEVIPSVYDDGVAQWIERFLAQAQ